MILRKEMNKEKGATLIEYALLVALVAVIAIGGLRFLGEEVSNAFSEVANEISNATP